MPLGPIIGPLLAADEDGWFAAARAGGWKVGDGPAKDCDGKGGAIFCFFREAETEGLGNGS